MRTQCIASRCRAALGSSSRAAALLVLAACPSLGEIGVGQDATIDRQASGEGSFDATQRVDGRRDAGVGDATRDAARCAQVEAGASPAHGGPSCRTDASACTPGDMTTFSPRWVPPVTGAPYANVCSVEQIADAWAECLGASASTSGCAAFQAANAGCFGCLITDSTAAEYGALIVFDGPMSLSQLNLPGCLALAEPCNQACAVADLADFECDYTACSPASGPCAGLSYSEVFPCLTAADTTCGCMGYSAARECFASIVADPASHPAVALCNLANTTNFEVNFTVVAAYMCGPPR